MNIKISNLRANKSGEERDEIEVRTSSRDIILCGEPFLVRKGEIFVQEKLIRQLGEILLSIDRQNREGE